MDKKNFTNYDWIQAILLYGLNAGTHKAALFKTLAKFHKIGKSTIQWSDLAKTYLDLYIERPNVFYIITDAMGSFNNLNKYGIDTTSIDNYLIDNNYQIAYDAKSSYTETNFTITSIFYLGLFC